MSGYTNNLRVLSALLKRMRSDPNQSHTMLGKHWHRVKDSAIVKTGGRWGSEASPMETPTFHWISNAEGSAARTASPLVRSALSLVAPLAHFHVNFLRKLGGIDQEALKNQNENLLHWLSNLIFDPPTGFPLFGINTSQRGAQVEAIKEPTFCPLCVPILSHYLSGSEAYADIRKLSSILIRVWYRETKALNRFFKRPGDLEAAIHQFIMTTTT